ncbi:putative amino acid transporter [Aspergillus costaricaensis CBS 115574]|uniref:Amino acid transporter n=1 Tax=Aspergillus costaricaensis CBS 115574 TaxID=1448317 RepID=A0ACD1I9D8_9EURO|nr:putative amino acid transporter [Aspergillus costaricaensis CBS 115574]RAK86392.1 putative amino acid transporter [Aspergillus costaricaensis CBS 115574]
MLTSDQSHQQAADLEFGHEHDLDGIKKKNQNQPDINTDNDPFGNEETAEVKYRTMKWWQCGTLMVAENISLGILSLPSAVATLGMVPFAGLVVFISALSWYTGIIIGQFKIRHPWVHSMADAGHVLFDPIGREIIGIGQLLLLIFIMGSHIVTFTILMNTLTNHRTCSIVFGLIGLFICFLCALPRTMEKVVWMSIASFLSILVATIATIIATGIEAKEPVALDSVREVSFYKAFLAVTNIIFAYIAHVAFFGFISEMEEPHTFPKSLAMLQIVDTAMYLITGLLIYRYVGRDVQSPALSSAGPLMRKVAYGLAIPTVIISGVVFGHVASKYVYVRMYRGSDRMHERSFVSVGFWVGIALIIWTIAWIIAESIPAFNDLLSLVSSLFGSIFSYGLPAIFWLSMNRGSYNASASKIFLTMVNIAIIGIAFAICGMGLYVSGRAIKEGSSHGSWACSSNI